MKMDLQGFLHSIARDNRGSVVVEFAMLLPATLTLVLGVIQMGLQMHGYNALRAVAADTARYTIVQFQNKTLLSASQIQEKAEALASNAPYGLDADNLVVVTTTPASSIAGTKIYSVQLTYQPQSILDFAGVKAPRIVVTRNIYVKS